MTGGEIINLINNSPSGQIGGHKIENTFRRMYVPGNAFAQSNPTPAVAGNPDPSVPTVSKAWGMALGPTGSDSATAVFMVPIEFIQGFPPAPFPRLHLLWGTDSTQAGTDRKVHFTVSFEKMQNFTGATVPIPQRYTVRANANPGPNNEMECPVPPSGGMIDTLLYEDFDGWANGSTPIFANDWVILTITRINDADDPNTGNMIIYGVAYEYFADY